jgi:Holliday junction resolvase RusA-like endonuclease
MMSQKPKKPIEAPVCVDILCLMPIPKSTTKKGRKAMLSHWNGYPTMPHTKKPDADNLEKAIWDAMTGIILKDDSQIFGHSTFKHYAEEPRIEITIYEYDDE